ncbi:hypothetical protein P9112_011121 [Eukaryota sp. TZLM1-RC]
MSLDNSDNTIFIRNLPYSATSDDLSSLCDDIGPVKRAFVIDSKDPVTGVRKSRGIGFVEFSLTSDALQAVNELNNKTFKDRKLSIHLAKKNPVDTQSKNSAIPSESIPTPALPNRTVENKRKSSKKPRSHKPWRLIVRNLPFSINLKRLTQFFEPIGELDDVYYPTREFKGKQTGTGFAFVTFVKKEDAEKAINDLNATKLGQRDVIIDYCVSKDKHSINDQSDDDVEVDESQEEVKESQEEEDELSTTFFLRNLCPSTKTGELVKLFSKFGNIDYVKLVKDRVTRLPRGTAFLKFSKQSSFDKCLAVSNLTPPFINGRVLEVLPALGKDQVASQGVKNIDKRNLYLAAEGDILPESDSFQALPKADQEKRRNALREKEEKLQNPNFCVSSTRLLVRNIPKNIEEKSLKVLFKSAGASAAELFGDPSLLKVKLKQIKLLKETDRLDANGQPMSKGICFVQYHNHLQALAALRSLNNSPDVEDFGGKRPIVEFAIDNVRMLQKFNHTLMKTRESQAESGKKNSRKRRSSKKGEVEEEKEVNSQVKPKSKKIRFD